MRLAFITPPLLQPNTPYPAMPVLSGWFRKQGFQVKQYDFSIRMLLRMLSPDVLEAAGNAVKARSKVDDEALSFFVDSLDDYKRTIPHVIAYLQGKEPFLEWRIAARTYLPEGPYFAALDPEGMGEEAEAENLDFFFGRLGTLDKAKYLASLYLDDVSTFISRSIEPAFQLGKYAEKLSVSLPTFDPILDRLEEGRHSLFDDFLDGMTSEMLSDWQPDWVAITIPFPGTLYGAFRIARQVKHLSNAKVVIGGGYVNSELRQVNDRRIYNYIDEISYDEGFAPLYRLFTGKEDNPPEPEVLVPDYTDLRLEEYFPVTEVPNPMHRIWTDGRWAKMQIARGCYWHKCAFCDLALDYICRYVPAPPAKIADAMERVIAETGLSGFHFVDEAIAPAVVRGLCEEILRRNLCVTWWGNIRFDKAFTPELASLMADAGCVAVTGGLECGHNRLLKLMNKGITTEGAEQVMRNFRDAGIMVHAYLMYGFPTETRQEVMQALDFVRHCFSTGILQSAFWHRFALTAHSAIARNPEQFGIRLAEDKAGQGRLFARNEIGYTEDGAPDWGRIGPCLEKAVYNFMEGRGLDVPARKWIQ